MHAYCSYVFLLQLFTNRKCSTLLNFISLHSNIEENIQDGNGFINRQELGQVMENLGENMDKEEIECLINEIDIDGDGQINYEEFYTMMCTK